MSKVLEEELEDDDFYKTTYGGFEEEEEDGDFKSEQEDSADEVDSDFDNPEEEEDNGEASEDDKPKRRKKGVNTKAYKEPNPKTKKARFDNADEMVLYDEENLAAPETPSPKRKKTISKEKSEDGGEDEDEDMQVRKSSRRATAKNSLLTHIRKKERDEEHKKKKENPRKLAIGVRRLTQEELMAEAEKTEKKNVKSLENYLRLEESRKKSMNLNKRSIFDGMATLMSLSMTMHTPDESREEKDNRMAQEFYVFSDYMAMEEHYDECMKTIPQPKNQPICPVSGKPARYRDPVTNIPYYDVASLKEIRAAYEAEMTSLSNTSSSSMDTSNNEHLIKTELLN